MFKIENDIPIPPKQSGGKPMGRKAIYPLADLDIGQSFFVPCRPGKTATQTRNALSGSITQCSKKTGARFTTRIIDGGARVWRLS